MARETFTINDGVSKREYTKEGYLVIRDTPLGRVGILKYKPGDFAKRIPKHIAEKDVIKVLRSPDELFDNNSVVSHEAKPITIKHPPKWVDSNTYQITSHGHSGDKIRVDGDFIRGDLYVTSKDAIEYVEKIGDQISPGYDTFIEWTPGTYNGEEYDGIQRDILVNHFAIVKRARGGDKMKLEDEHMGEENVKTSKIRLNDELTVEIEKEQADKVTRFFESIQDSMDTLKEKSKTLKAEKESVLKELEILKAERDATQAQIESLKERVSDSAIEAAVKERQAVVSAAKLLNPNVKTEGKSIRDIKISALENLMDGLDDETDDYINASFETSLKFKDVKAKKVEKLKDSLSEYKSEVEDPRKQMIERNKKLNASGIKGVI